MSTTKKKTRQTSRNTASRSKKRQPSSKTRSSSSQATPSRRKNGISLSAEASTNGTYSSSTATGKEKAKKSSASYRHEHSPQLKSDAWANYDFENLPELTDEQLATFRRVKPEEFRRLSRINEIQVVRDRVVVERKKVGRPKKDLKTKENIVGIRLSQNMIERLKQLAKEAGGIGWQTYAKRILEEHLEA